MGNAEIVVKAEGVVKWLNTTKTGVPAATAQTLGYCKGGMRMQITRHREAILNDDGSYAHWKETMAPDVSVTVSRLYRDWTNDLLGGSANGYVVSDPGITCALGTLILDMLEAAASATYDSIHVQNATIMSYSVSSNDAGNVLEMTFAAVGEPTFSTAATTATLAAAGNAEVVVKANSYAKFKSDAAAAVAQTIGFIGSWKYTVTYNKKLVRKNDGSFSHAKILKAPACAINISQMYQDSVTNLLADTANGYNVKKTGQSVPTGTIAIENLWADGATLESAQFPKATLMNWNYNTQEDGNTLDLTFNSVGAPTYAAATLA